MSRIINNIRNFSREVQRGSCLRVTSQGNFYVINSFTSTLKGLLGLDKYGWVKVSESYRKVLQELESIPVQFSEVNTEVSQSLDFLAFIEAGNAILEKLENDRRKGVRKEIYLLKRELVALSYRLEEVNGGLAPVAVSEEEYQVLVEAAQAWKSAQVVFDDTALSLDDTNILRDVCRYRAFISLALSDPELLVKFLEWALRDRNPIVPFIEYPSIQQKINDFDLNGRIGSMKGDHLKVVKNHSHEDPSGILQKIVTLPFEGRDINILDENRFVLFRGNYSLTIKEIFEEFSKKRYGDSNLEFMSEGIINWNSFLWGWWDEDIQDYHLVDLDDPEWWKQLPSYEVLSLREARERYGNHLDGRQWNFAAISTRERDTLDFEGAHAYSSIAIPLGDSRYAIYPFGKFAMKFPPNLLDALLNIGHTSDATIAFPDENVFYTHRQRSRYSFALNEQQGLAYMESVKQDMLTSRAGNLIYQIESENCAKWTHKKIEEIVGVHRIPNVFQMPFLNSQPHGVMAKVFSAIKSLPERWQIPVTLSIHFMFGAYKGVWIWEEGKQVWKSLTYHAFWEDTVIYHPSMLHRQQELGIIGNSVSQGVTFTKNHIHHSFHGLHHKMVIFGEYIVNEAAKAIKLILAFMRDLLFSLDGSVSSEEKITLSLIQLTDENNEFQVQDQQPQLLRVNAHKGGTEYAQDKSLSLETLRKSVFAGH